MPVSLVLYLDTRDPLPAVYFGREVQAWFIQTVGDKNRGLARALHDGQGQKPYTVSGLIHLPEALRNLAPAPFIIRITALESSFEDWLTGPFITIIRDHPNPMRLWYSTLRIRGYSCSADESPWAGRLSYQNLKHTAKALEDLRFQLEFISPTGFRSNGEDITQPVPALVFRTCLQKWNLFAPPELIIKDGLLQFIRENLVSQIGDDYENHRIIFAQGKRGGAVGFTGKVDFSFSPSCSVLHREADIADRLAEIRALAMYSFFCGIGHHTTIGLGQTFPRLLTGTTD